MESEPPSLINSILHALQSANNLLVVPKDGVRIERPFKEVWPDVESAMWYLRALGLQRHDRVGLLASNCYEYVVIDLACIGLGLVLTPFDVLEPQEAMRMAEALHVRVVFTDREDLVDGKAILTSRILLSEHRAEWKMPLYEYAPDEVVAIKCTSGSTGPPKALGALRSSIDNSMNVVQELFGHQPSDRMLVFLPLHLLQQRYWVYSAILFGYDLTITNAFYAPQALMDERPTVVMGVPEFYEVLEKLIQESIPRAQKLWLRRIMRVVGWFAPAIKRKVYAPVHRLLGGRIRYLWSGSAALRLETFDFFKDIGVDVYQGYGSNEACIVAKNYPQNSKRGSAGRVVPNKHVIIEPDGHILVKSAHPVTNGYLLDEGASGLEKTFIRPGYVATGDLGYLDDDGYLFILGRKKDLIILPSGRKIHPQFLEARLTKLPGVRYAMVIGGTHERPFPIALVDVFPGTAQAEVARALPSINEGLPGEAHIKGLHVTSGAFTRDNGLLTSQYKLRRPEIARKFASEIAHLHRNRSAT